MLGLGEGPAHTLATMNPNFKRGETHQRTVDAIDEDAVISLYDQRRLGRRRMRRVVHAQAGRARATPRARLASLLALGAPGRLLASALRRRRAERRTWANPRQIPRECRRTAQDVGSALFETSPGRCANARDWASQEAAAPPMKKPIRELFDLRAGELAPTLLMSVYFFLVITSFWILKPIKKSLFLRFYKAEPLELLGMSSSDARAEQLAKMLNMLVAVAGGRAVHPPVRALSARAPHLRAQRAVLLAFRRSSRSVVDRPGELPSGRSTCSATCSTC